MPAAIQDGALHPDIGGSRRGQNVLRASDPVLHHARGVFADGVVDFWRGDAVPVLQYGIQRHLVMFLRQVLANRGQPDALSREPAIRAVMVGTPGQPSIRLADDRLHDRPDPATELERVATNETA